MASDTFDCSEVFAENSSLDMTNKRQRKNFEIFNLDVDVDIDSVLVTKIQTTQTIEIQRDKLYSVQSRFLQNQ